MAKPDVPPARPRGPLEFAMGDSFTRPLKAAEVVARDIVHDIVEAGLGTGDKLPGEAAMLQIYETSRESLREGLRLLEVQGLITLRRGPGGGPTVGRIDPGSLGRQSSLYFHLASATYHELFEAHRVMESVLAERAARNADVDAKYEALSEFLQPGAGEEHLSTEDFVHSHARFHALVASLAQNRVLELTMQIPGAIVSHHVAESADPRAVSDLLDRDHADLARAIIAGHANRARVLMNEHIETVGHYFHVADDLENLIEWQ